MNALVIGLDLGFSSLGYGVVALAPLPKQDQRVEDIGVFHTSKSDAKQSLYATEDNLRRARDIASFLHTLIQKHQDQNNRVIATCVEAMSWPRNAGVTAKLGIGWGVFAAVSSFHALPVLQASPQQIKLATARSKSASKEDVQRAVLEALPFVNPRKFEGRGSLFEVTKDVPSKEWRRKFSEDPGSHKLTPWGRSPLTYLPPNIGIKKTDREHVFDALAVVLTCQASELIASSRLALADHMSSLDV